MGRTTKETCLITLDNIAEKLALSFVAHALDKLGNTAVAKDIPKIPTGTARKLSAKVKIASEPAAKEEAMAVMAKIFMFVSTKFGILGSNKIKVSYTPSCIGRK